MLEIWNQGTMDHYNLSTDVLPWMQPRESEIAQTNVNHTTEQDITGNLHWLTVFQNWELLCGDITHIAKSGLLTARTQKAGTPGSYCFMIHFKLAPTDIGVLDRSCTIAHNKWRFSLLSEPGESAQWRLTSLLHRNSLHTREMFALCPAVLYTYSIRD